jgi:tetratricopeptide (TPR) repeat protein
MAEGKWTIDGLELDRRSFSLRRNGEVLRLDPKPLELLFLLVESQGDVVSHDQALRRVWGEGVFVNGEAALYTAIKKIRKAVGDPALIDAEVHDRYLRARYLLSQRTRPTIQAAMRYFQEALAIDPAFAPAIASLAFCHALLPITSTLRPHDCFPSAQSMATVAMALDPTQADAQIALGLVDFWFRRDWGAARAHFTESAMLNPGDSAPPMFLAHTHSVLGRHEEALITIAAALRLDPISPIVRAHHGHFLYNAGRSREALIPLRQVLELSPQFWVAHLMQGKALATPDHAPDRSPDISNSSAEAIQSFLLSERFSMGNTEGLVFRICRRTSWPRYTRVPSCGLKAKSAKANFLVGVCGSGILMYGIGGETCQEHTIGQG